MTTLTSADGPSEVINARRTESLDAPSILKLVQPATEALFGRVNIVNLIEKAVLAVTLSNDREEVLGHAAFLDYPNLPGVDPADWESWMRSHYDSTKCNALNTLFMHYFVGKPEYSHGCAREIIRTVFNAVPDVHYCFLVVPTGVYPESALGEIFSQMDGLEGIKGPANCVLFACYRHEHVPVLHVRMSRVEDHDDLVPIFNRQSDMLKNTYGNFFLAELIEAQDDNMKCLVAENDGTAVGFLSISNDVNVDLLNECYELGPFHGFRKPHQDDQLEPEPTPTPPPGTAEQDRPTSARSDGSQKCHSSCSSLASSASSKSSRVSKRGSAGAAVDKSRSSSKQEKPKAGSPRTVSSKSSRSAKALDEKVDDVKIKGKLSDADLGQDSASVLSDQSDVESVKSEALERDLSTTLSRQTAQTAGDGLNESAATKPPTPRAILPKRFVPNYKGESTAFCIQLFCIDEKFEMRSEDFLPKAFELFPDAEFCVITVPHLVPEFPLLQQFVRISPRVPSTLAQELYVFSRPGLLKSFQVRAACESDFSGCEKLVKTLDMNENLLECLLQYNKARRDEEGTEFQAFVAECSKQVVGIAITRREEDIEYIRSHYNIEDFIYFNHHRRDEHGHLLHYALNPIFKHYSKHFLKEVLRLGHKTCLYYPLFPAHVSKEALEKHTLVSALDNMVPVRGRRQIDYPLEELGINAPSERVVKKQTHYALNHINRKLTLEPKVTINARIVVIGASDVGVGFLEAFAFCPHLRFNNLTLISPHGLPGELPPDPIRDQMLSSSHCYCQDEYDQLALRAWCNIVYGSMTAINRKKKHVVVNHSTIVPYDHLVLCTGRQYQVPAPTEADISQLVTSNEVPNTPDRLYDGVPPKNVFTINDNYDAAVALYWIRNNLLHSQGNALVYGNSLDAYCCVQTLLTEGIPGERILLVEPPLNYETTCFNNPEVENALYKGLKEAGVEVHSGYLLAQWNDGNESEEVFAASFTSQTKPLRLECSAFYAYYKKQVNYQAFKAMNDACLVYDGRLVIDADFHTNDVSIRAAGALTKFQRSYHADQWSHANFNSKEVGIQLASLMLSLFDPTLEPELEPPEDLLKLIPMYRTAKVQGAVIPGGYHYLHIGKPSLSTPLEVLRCQSDYGREIVTGSPGGALDYFCLHINQYNTVEAVTCLAKKPLPATNLICLFGLHERYLNNLVSRWNEGLIQDLYSYFQETWCLAIYHDRFPDFRDEVRELLVTKPAADIEALEEKVRNLIEEDLSLSKGQRKSLWDSYTESGAKRAVETRLLSFLSYNYYHLTMYAKPGMV